MRPGARREAWAGLYRIAVGVLLILLTLAVTTGVPYLRRQQSEARQSAERAQIPAAETSVAGTIAGALLVSSALIVAALWRRDRMSLIEQRLAFERERAALAESATARSRLAEAETQRLLADAERSRLALVSILEDERDARSALRDSSARFQTVFDHAGDGMFVLDLESQTIVLANAACTSMLGFTPEELRGMGVPDLHPPEDVPFVVEQMESYLNGGSGPGEDIRFRRNDGSAFFAELHATRLTLDGRPCSLVDFRDTSDRRRAQAALLESEQIFRTVFEGGPVGMVMANPGDGKFIRANAAFCGMVGRSEEELKRLTFADITHPAERSRDVAAVRRLWARQITEYRTEKRYVRKDGGTIWATLSASLILRADGTPLFSLAIVEDVTDRKRASERLRTLSQRIITAREEERKQVSAVLHHDVGSLSVGLAAHVDAIEQELNSGDIEQARRWTLQTRALLSESVASLRQLASTLRPPDLDILGLIPALRQHFSQIMAVRGVQIRLRHSSGCRPVSGAEATVLFRIAQEAVNNAIIHGHARRIVVRVKAVGSAVRLTILDNGKGFGLARQQASGAAPLGLKVMREMAASVGGTFTLTSVESKGTTVVAALPAEAIPEELDAD